MLFITRGSFRGVQRESVENGLHKEYRVDHEGFGKRNVPAIAYSSVNDDGTMFSEYRQQREGKTGL